MYQKPMPHITSMTPMSRIVRNAPLKYVDFSGTGYTPEVHQKTYLRPAVSVRIRNTSATGRNATYGSMKRITPRDQRAVVMRCTATNVTPALDSTVKNSQFAWNADQ